MKIKRLFWTAITMALAILPLSAQSTQVFAPFISALQGEVKNGLIRLSWIDSPDIKGPVYIYRSTQPFEGSDQFHETGAKPVEIPYGVQSYVDEIDTGGTVYYFAVASDETGRTFGIPISATNTIKVQISEESPVPVVIENTTPEKIPDFQAGISALEANAQGERIVITFNGGSVKSAALYRSIRPINQTPDLLGAVILQTKISSPFMDYPVPGIPYYYAVVAEDDLVQGKVEIIPGRNATMSPVEASTNTGSSAELRAIPLPQISTQAVAPGASAYAETAPAELSPQAASALGNIPAKPAEPELKKPRVFARDLGASAEGGEELLLASVIKGPFTAKNWQKARDELTAFLALPRNPETKARARFYLGQSYYFLHQPREGLFEFLSIQERYPTEAAEWIQASLDMLKR